MPGDAHRSKVGDYVTLLRGTTYKGALVGEPGPALLGLGSIEPGGGFRIGNYKTYGGDCPNELMLIPGDIYASLKGATKDGKMIGSVARVPPSVPSGRLTQDTVKLVFRSRNAEDETYLYWVLRTPQYRDYCAGHAMGSAVVALSRRDFLSYPVPPPTAHRRMVIALLDLIEEKIELNRRMNETLEEMARAFFKSWFVDFDPVRAKAEGRDPGLPQPLADMFPDSFEGSKLGKIPKGWEVRTLGDLLELAYGKALKAENRRDGDIPVYGSNGQVGWHDEGLVTGPGIVVGRKGNPGIATWVATDFFPIDTTFYVVPKATCRSMEFLFHVLRTHDLASLGADSAVPGLNRNLAYMSRQVLPPPHLRERFSHLASTLSQRVHQSNDESCALAALRDSLLPKLISGEIRLDETKHLSGMEWQQ
jgi:restriction endonuclease S subunit